MRYSIWALLLGLWLLPACDELVDAEGWPSNRTLDENGGTVALDRVSVEVYRSSAREGTNLRLEEADPATVPSGAVAEAYTLILSGAPDFELAAITYRIDVEELPDSIYFVDLTLARAEEGEWVPLETTLDPVHGIMIAQLYLPGTYAIVSLP